MDQCCKKIPAVVHGKETFIDSHTKILYLHASENPCILGLPPAIQTIEGEYVTYLPQKMVLKPSNAYYDNASQDISPNKLY